MDDLAFHIDEVRLVPEVGAEQVITFANKFLVVAMNTGGNAVYGHDALLERFFGSSREGSRGDMPPYEAKCVP